MVWRIEVTPKNEQLDSEGKDVLANARDLNLRGLQSIRSGWIYLLDEAVSDKQVKMLAERLLSDPIEHDFAILEEEHATASLIPDAHWEIEVRYKKGVTDSTADSVLRGAEDLGIKELEEVRTGRLYWLKGSIEEKEAERLASGLLANGIIQDYEVRSLK